MEKVLYYVVDLEVNGDELSWTGWREITVYSIVDNKPVEQFRLEHSSEDPFSIEEVIQNYLDDNGMGDDEFRFERL